MKITFGGGEAANGASFEAGDVAGHGERLQIDLRSHDGGADRENHPSIQTFHGAAEQPEIQGRSPAYSRAAKHRVGGDNVVSDAGMNSEGEVVPESLGENGTVLPGMLHLDATVWQ